MEVSPLAGRPAPPAMLVNVPRLVTAYYAERPDPSVAAQRGWFAARPSGTEAVYKIYAESFLGAAHLKQIQEEAQALIARVFQQESGRQPKHSVA
jgi:hypothetical protein